MDKRQMKTRKAIFDAFVRLLEHKNYNSIIVQDIIDEALIGRSTFYAHFETKEDLLEALCQELFSHIIDTASDFSHAHGLYKNSHIKEAIFLHILQHLEDNDNNILGLLSCESNELFLRHFKNSLKELIQSHFLNNQTCPHNNIPHDFISNHIAGSFVEMVLWWLETNRQYSIEDMSRYFYHITEPLILEHQHE